MGSELYGRFAECIDTSALISILKNIGEYERICVTSGDDVILSLYFGREWFNFYFSMDEILDFVQSVNNIGILEVSFRRKPTQTDDIHHFSEMLESVRVKHIRIWGWRQEGMTPIIEALKSNLSIDKLDFNSSYHIDISKVCEVIECNTAITKLRIENCGVEDITRISQLLETNKTLKSLNLTRNKIQDIGGLSKALTTNVTLEVLKLTGNNIPNVKPLEEAMRYNPSLEFITLENVLQVPDTRKYGMIYTLAYRNLVRKRSLFEMMFDYVQTQKII